MLEPFRRMRLASVSAKVQRATDWRVLVGAAVSCAVLLPTLWLVVSNLKGPSVLAMMGMLHGPFIGALKRSYVLMAAVVAGALALGWPGGTLIGLVGFPGRRLFLATLAVPLFTPSFLWAIGLSSFRPFLAYRHQWWLDGFPGVLLTGVVQPLPLVVFATVLAMRTLPASLLDAARLSGGFLGLFKLGARFSVPASLGAAVLGGALTLVDPGPAQIMGYHGIASEILIAFAARYDAGLAARKALLMAALLLPVLLAVAWKVSTWSEARLLGREVRRGSRRLGGVLPAAMVLAFVAISFALLVPALAGLARPLKGTQTAGALRYGLTVLEQSARTTLRYGFTAALVATALGVLLTLTWGRNHRLRFALLLFSFLFLSLPPSVHALGFAGMAAHLPRSCDWFMRGGNAVGIAFGLRLLPIPALVCLRTWSLMPESCHQVAAVHGVPVFLYLWRVALPQLAPAIAASFLLVASLSVADVSSMLLLLPPGASTFTSRIFGVIDNTSESILSGLCVVYVLSGLVLMFVFSIIEARWRRRPKD
jgi:ABC-type Fe3+ transport system permease subunit